MLNMKLRRLIHSADTLTLAMLIGFAVTLILTSVTSFSENVKALEDSVFRLHILANSDSEADQTLKLKVRDAVLAEVPELFGDCQSKAEAEAAAAENLPQIVETAKRTLRENGCEYDVSAQICEMHFDDRTYGNIVMPSGKYSALRITIGNAKGKNWWCVMFPSLCLPAAMDFEGLAEESEGYFTDEELYILENHSEYEVRFYFAELFEKLLNNVEC